MKIIKRNGAEQSFDSRKIRNAIRKANQTVSQLEELTEAQMDKITEYVTQACAGYDRAVGVEEIQDIVEKQLMAMGAFDVAKNYVVYRKKRERARNVIRIRTGHSKEAGDVTDQSLLLVNSMTDGNVTAWNRDRIAEKVSAAIGLDKDKADEIAKDVENQLIASGLTMVSTALIRELINNALVDHGFNGRLEDLTMYRIPRDFILSLLNSKNNENANVVSNNPEAVAFDVASLALKQFAFDYVFSPEVAEAHRCGLVHVHDANFPTRVYCSSHSIEYIKKYGLKNIGTLNITSKPAKSASVLTGHLNTFLAAMQAYYAGALGLGFINIFYAPYLTGMSDKEIKQVAQELIFNCSQNAFSRGGQCLFIDANISTGVPSYLKQVPAIGPGGKYMFSLKGFPGRPVSLEEDTIDGDWCLVYPGVRHSTDADGEAKDESRTVVLREHDGRQEMLNTDLGRVLTYGDFELEARRFCSALLQVWKEGDAYGHIFEFPKCDFHVSTETFTDEEQLKLFHEACELASHNGSTYFVFDRDEVSLASCCFTGDTKVLTRGGVGSSVHLSTFKELAETPYDDMRTNLSVYHNGGWSRAKLVATSGVGKKIYKITTANKKEQKVTEDHIVPTLAGDKAARDVTADDYILFSTRACSETRPDGSSEPKNATYAQGVLIGAYLGDGSIEQQKEWRPSVQLSLNKDKYEELSGYIKTAMSEWDVDGELKLHTPYHNVYPVYISSWGLVEKIREWVHGDYSYSKELSLGCLRESKAFRKGIVDGLYATAEGNSNRIYTTSDKLVEVLEALFTSLGLQTVIDVSDRTGEGAAAIRDKKFNRNYPLYCIRWYDNAGRRQYDGLYATRNNSVFYKVDHIEELPEEKTVYCFEIQDSNEPYFTLPSGIITHNCRLKVQITDMSLLRHPERLRTCGFQNITVNLPQCAYRARHAKKGNLEASEWDLFLTEVDKAMDIALAAHLQKKEFVAKLMEPGGPLQQLGRTANDGYPYLRLEDCVYIIGMIGANDAIQYLTGKQFHEDDKALDLGLQLISYMYLRTKEYSSKHNLVFKLEESPAESAARRLAKADLMYFRDDAPKVYKGGSEDAAYYTNSIHIAADAPVCLVDRIRKQSMFHSAIESGAIIHAFIGEEKPDADAIGELVREVLLRTQAAQLTFSPEFTYCLACGAMQRGLQPECNRCGSEDVVGETRVVGYFSRIQNWNKSKRYGELVARHHGEYAVSTADAEEDANA